MSDQPIRVTERIEIPASDLTYEFARSGGPGGQHVNTTDSSVRLRFALRRTAAIGPAVKERIARARPGSLTKDGELLVTCERHRSRHMNLEEARDKLAELVREHLVPPKPRHATKPTRSSKERRLDKKSARGKTKSMRGRVNED